MLSHQKMANLSKVLVYIILVKYLILLQISNSVPSIILPENNSESQNYSDSKSAVAYLKFSVSNQSTFHICIF